MGKKNTIKRIKQSAKEKKIIDELYNKKSKVQYSFVYSSSSFKTSEPQLGTIEADAAGRFGRWKKENYRAEKLAILCSTLYGVKSVLDIGGG